MNDGGQPAPPLRDDLLTWASETMGLSAQSDSDQIRRSAFEQLAKLDFSPSESWHTALVVILGPESKAFRDVPDSYFEIREEQLNQQIDNLAQEFFQLSPEQRRARWDELYPVCQPWPQLRLWLDQLKRGLDVRPESLANTAESIQVLGTLICRSFVLPPARRASLLLNELTPSLLSQSFRETAVHTLWRFFPKIASLDEQLLDDLIGKPRSEPIPKKSTKKRRPKVVKEAVSDDENMEPGPTLMPFLWMTIAFFLIAMARSCSSNTERPVPNQRRYRRHVELDQPLLRPVLVGWLVPGGNRMGTGQI